MQNIISCAFLTGDSAVTDPRVHVETLQLVSLFDIAAVFFRSGDAGWDIVLKIYIVISISYPKSQHLRPSKNPLRLKQIS